MWQNLVTKLKTVWKAFYALIIPIAAGFLVESLDALQQAVETTGEFGVYTGVITAIVVWAKRNIA